MHGKHSHFTRTVSDCENPATVAVASVHGDIRTHMCTCCQMGGVHVAWKAPEGEHCVSLYSMGLTALVRYSGRLNVLAYRVYFPTPLTPVRPPLRSGAHALMHGARYMLQSNVF